MEESADLQTPKEHIFTGVVFGNIYKLLKEDVISVSETGSNKDIVIDISNIEDIVSIETEKTETTTDISKAESEKAMRQSIKALVQRNVISIETALLTGNIIRPSDIEMSDGHTITFCYSHSRFPQPGEKRGVIETGDKRLATFIEDIEERLQNEGITLPKEKLKEVALRIIYSHEYGHALDRSLRTKRNEDYSQLEVNNTESLLTPDCTDDVYKNIFVNIAPSVDLAELFPLQDGSFFSYYGDGRETSSERIAVGFEHLGFQFALEDIGIPQDKISKILKIYSDEEKAFFEDLKQIFLLAKEKGMDVENFGSAYGQFLIELEKAGKTDVLKNMEVVVGSNLAGYYFPLSENQLKDYISSFSEEKLPTLIKA